MALFIFPYILLFKNIEISKFFFNNFVKQTRIITKTCSKTKQDKEVPNGDDSDEFDEILSSTKISHFTEEHVV